MRKCCDVIAKETGKIAYYIHNMEFNMTERNEQINDCAYSHDQILKGLAEIEKGFNYFYDAPRPDVRFFKPIKIAK